MTLWINKDEDKEGVRLSDFDKLGGSLAEAACRLDCTEILFKKQSDELAMLFLHVESHPRNALVCVEDKAFQTAPRLYQLKVPLKTYQAYDMKAKKQVSKEPEKYHLALSMVLGEYEGKVIKGELDLSLSEKILDTILEGGDKSIMMRNLMIEPTEVSEPVHLTANLKYPSGVSAKSGWSSSKGQTELEKLDDRIAFMRRELGKLRTLDGTENLLELYGIAKELEMAEVFGCIFR